ncbi:hypothetical protein AURDEDRAFT_169473 [Auricularia subglabra TFB-10046 SS5]|nr:hypothetical protein AURDEDRAFT_169473 [Auricularia subglabra TFB-10046 SS5]
MSAPDSGGRSAVPAPVPSASPSSGSLDDWKAWPENDPKFDALFDDVWPLRDEFCECKRPKCQFCSETREVFHVSEYTASGASVMNRKINTKELQEHLQALQRLDKSNAKTAGHPTVGMFFACGNHVDNSLKYAYMRRFLAYCQVPPHFVFKRTRSDIVPVFQIAYETPLSASDAVSKPTPAEILHIHLQCFSYIRPSDLLRNTGYFSATFEQRVRAWAPGSFKAASPTLYLRYDESSRESVIYVADARSHSTPCGQRIVEYQKYLRSRRDTLGKTISLTRNMDSLDHSRSAMRFDFLASDGPAAARMRHEVSSMVRAIRAIQAEYEAFVVRMTDIHGDVPHAHVIRSRFKQQLALALELESAVPALESGGEIINTLLMSRAQLLNGVEMATMTKDNKKQAEATEAIARDARRDSEIMKTITVVTLVYLPATFVSTLLSMGIFEFGAGKDDDGRLRIAREGWVFFAIALPLTLLTLVLAYLRARSKERQWASEGRREAAVAQNAQEQAANTAAIEADAQSEWTSDKKDVLSDDGESPHGAAEKMSENAESRAATRESLGDRVMSRWHPRRRRETTELEAGTAKT